MIQLLNENSVCCPVFSPSVDQPLFSSGDVRQGETMVVSSGCIKPTQHLCVVKSVQPIACDGPTDSNILKIFVFRRQEGAEQMASLQKKSKYSNTIGKSAFSQQLLGGE